MVRKSESGKRIINVIGIRAVGPKPLKVCQVSRVQVVPSESIERDQEKKRTFGMLMSYY